MVIPAWSLGALEFSEGGLHFLFACFIALWTIALGASIGSFLNVVIYRMPRGMSLVHPKSRCPACDTPIRPTDNLPILGWLRLGGRCRACGSPIAVRYPIVEGLVAILLFALVWCEVYSGGINLPGGRGEGLVTDLLLWRFNPADIVRMGYHAFLLVVAVAVGYIAWDGFPPPRRLVIVSLVLGIIVPLFLPAVWPVESGLPHELPHIAFHAEGGLSLDANSLATAAIGLAGGLLAGALLGVSARQRFDFLGVLFLASLAGLYLGWQALLTFAPLAGILAMAAGGISRSISRPTPATIPAGLALVVQVFAWRWLSGVPEGLAAMARQVSISGMFVVPLTAAVITGILAVGARKMVLAIPARSIGQTTTLRHDSTRTLDQP